MKVFACKNQDPYGGGLILVAANTKKEAFNTAAEDDNCWVSFNKYKLEEGSWIIKSDRYPFNEWFEVEHLSTDVTKPKVIIEDYYSE